MQKIILGIVVFLVVVGGVWYVLTSARNDETTIETDHEVTTTDSDTVSDSSLTGQGSLAGLMASGQQVKCSYDGSVADGATRGLFYTDGRHFRVESTYVGAAGTIASTIINTGDYTYTWGSSPAGNMAIKMSNQDAVDPSSYQGDAQAGVDVDTDVSYSCAPWAVEASMFVPPADVEFVDMQAMMQDAMDSLPEGMTLPMGYPGQ